jgi:hypothetical protein
MRLILAAALLAGCYTAPRPLTAQEQRDQASRAYYDQQEYARQQAAAAERARAEQLCAATTDVSTQLKCMEWRQNEQRLSDLRHQEAERIYLDAQHDKDQKALRRAAAGPANCISSVVGTTVITNCF